MEGQPIRADPRQRSHVLFPNTVAYQYRWSGAAWNVMSRSVWMSATSTPRCMIYRINVSMIEFVLVEMNSS
jgi:hypothetical protein